MATQVFLFKSMNLGRDELIKVIGGGLKDGTLGMLDALSMLQTNKAYAKYNNNNFWRNVFVAKNGFVAVAVAKQTVGDRVNFFRYMLSSEASTQLLTARPHTVAVILKKARPDNKVPVYLLFEHTHQGVMYGDFSYGDHIMDRDPFFTELYEAHPFMDISKQHKPEYRIFYTRSMETDAHKIFYDLLQNGWYVRKERNYNPTYIRNQVPCGQCVTSKTKCSECGTQLCESCFSEKHSCK